ncbi:outer membrane protein (OmpH-like) [Fulvivirga imtechensis AK7]|uniref:Outer membrane protein (OmpH-like) n=1 Tax=Fulvivirga imtechensis AK7 TaxID=1237149 RepID=L8JM30_9BACT|nr:OmpH family outer membrane protein [Fulvivirga imtechensis]ELR69991.1 outer membrane protein (OmpH-like) [Fulvivirga imtechensis AK7]
MKTKELLIIIISVVVAVAVAVAYFITHATHNNVAYVRSHDLIYSYEGTKEAMAKFDDKKMSWQANVDTLRRDFQRSVAVYNRDYDKLSSSERKQREEMLNNQQQQLETYSQAIDSKIREEDHEMMASVLNQVNSFIEDYAEQKGYDIIFGTTKDGSILYGNEHLDITDQVLKEINKRYKGE